MKLASQHPYEHHAFVMAMLPDLTHKTVLDIGCGKGVFGFLIRTNKQARRLIGCDINLEHLHFVKRHNIYDDLILMSAEKLPFRDKSMNDTMVVEVLEHLSKADGFHLLDEIDRITQDFALITTPNGFLPSLTPSNIYEIHKSGWKCNQLKSKGYKVLGVRLKIYHKYPSKLTYALQCIFTPFTRLIPKISAFLLAVKRYNTKDE